MLIIAEMDETMSQHFYILSAEELGDCRQGMPVQPLHEIPCLHRERVVAVQFGWLRALELLA